MHIAWNLILVVFNICYAGLVFGSQGRAFDVKLIAVISSVSNKVFFKESHC